jgi:steroid C-25 hydroxylase gamma subunit
MTTETGTVIHAARVPDGAGELSQPLAAPWEAIPGNELSLVPTPLDRQPSAYVQKAWANRPYGQVAHASLRAAVADGDLLLRVSWDTQSPRVAVTDTNIFADACGVLFPSDGHQAELSTMGDEAHPVEAWYWRSGTPDPFVTVAAGMGNGTRQSRHSVSVAADWSNGAWTVVFRRPLRGTGVPLQPGSRVPMGLAIWQGAADERAGLKSHTPEWLTLDIPA